MTFVDHILRFAGLRHGPMQHVTDGGMESVSRALVDVRRESANAICASMDAVESSQAIRKRESLAHEVISGLLRNL